MHDRSTSWFSWVIIIVVVIVFAMFGFSRFTGNNSAIPEMATVNGQSILMQSAQQTYNQLRERAKSENVFQATPAFEQLLKQLAFQQLVKTLALKQNATVQGYTLSPAITQSLIQSVPAFQDKGQFSPQRLQLFLQTHAQADQIIQDMETAALLNQVGQGYVQSEFVLPYEQAQAQALVMERRDVNYVSIPVSRFDKTAVKVNDADIQAFYDQHATLFTEPARVKLAYVVLPAASVDHDGDAFANISYSKPESLEPVAKALHLKIQETAELTHAGSASGLTSHKEIMQAAFSEDVLNNHNNSEVITLKNGDHVVVRVQSSQPASLRAFASVRTAIEKELAQGLRAKQAEDFALSLQKEAQAGSSLSALATKYGLQIHNLGWVSRDAKQVPAFILQTAFDQSPHDIKFIHVDKDSLALVQVQAVKSGVLTDARQKTQLAADMQTALGTLDYDLYVQSVMKAAKIDVKDKSWSA